MQADAAMIKLALRMILDVSSAPGRTAPVLNHPEPALFNRASYGLLDALSIRVERCDNEYLRWLHRLRCSALLAIRGSRATAPSCKRRGAGRSAAGNRFRGRVSWLMQSRSSTILN